MASRSLSYSVLTTSLLSCWLHGPAQSKCTSSKCLDPQTRMRNVESSGRCVLCFTPTWPQHRPRMHTGIPLLHGTRSSQDGIVRVTARRCVHALENKRPWPSRQAKRRPVHEQTSTGASSLDRQLPPTDPGRQSPSRKTWHVLSGPGAAVLYDVAMSSTGRSRRDRQPTSRRQVPGMYPDTWAHMATARKSMPRTEKQPCEVIHLRVGQACIAASGRWLLPRLAVACGTCRGAMFALASPAPSWMLPLSSPGHAERGAIMHPTPPACVAGQADSDLSRHVASLQPTRPATGSTIEHRDKTLSQPRTGVMTRRVSLPCLVSRATLRAWV